MFCEQSKSRVLEWRLLNIGYLLSFVSILVAKIGSVLFDVWVCKGFNGCCAKVELIRFSV